MAIQLGESIANLQIPFRLRTKKKKKAMNRTRRLLKSPQALFRDLLNLFDYLFRGVRTQVNRLFVSSTGTRTMEF